MNRKYIITFALGFAAIIGWNVFLIQRDERLYDSYYRAKAIENLQKPPSSDITYSPKERFCQSQAKWHPDCNLE
jgi:hypothetical protein